MFSLKMIVNPFLKRYSIYTARKRICEIAYIDYTPQLRSGYWPRYSQYNQYWASISLLLLADHPSFLITLKIE